MQDIKQQLIKHLEGGEAFLPIDKLLPRLPYDQLGITPQGLPYSLWQQFHHLTYCQKDILDFSINPDYQYPKWPEDYWVKDPAPNSESIWESTKSAYFHDRTQLTNLISNENTDLMKPFDHGKGQTLFREVLLVIEHTAYHTGQMAVIARKLNLL